MAPPHEPPSRAWQRMLSGRRLDLLDPSPGDIAIEDIAHGLARVARWNGQTIGVHAFSVAQHVLIVEDIAHALNPRWPLQWRLAALLHDAAEYVVGDLISPFKTAIGLDYKAFEMRLLDAIYSRFDVPVPLPADVAAAIKRADRIAAFFEATRLAGFSQDEAHIYFDYDEKLPDALRSTLSAVTAEPADTTQKTFLARFAALTTAA
jgi:5'-deoxynucleotidase YfbR-like HD superfamily hydrolase